jgi:hypothetical protein
MNWTTANTWAANLVYGDYSDWRLAINSPVNGESFNINYASNGSTDNGYNITSPYSDLAYMYYVNLDLKGYSDTAGNAQSNWGIFGNGIINDINSSRSGQNNVGLVLNLQNDTYWSNSEYAPLPESAWRFDVFAGYQGVYAPKVNVYHAWAVRPGDVAASSVPVPAAVWLFGSGLIGLVIVTRRKNKSSNLIAA